MARDIQSLALLIFKSEIKNIVFYEHDGAL